MYLDNGIPQPKYETHAGAIKRAARRWHSRSDSYGLNPIWQIGRDDGMGDNDTSSQPLDDWRGVSAARAKWRSGAMTLCRKRLGVRFWTEKYKDGKMRAILGT